MLEEANAAQGRGVSIVAEVLGAGASFDVSRGDHPDVAVAAVTRSMRQALEDANLEPADIDIVSASANGSILGDRNEAQALRIVFGESRTDLAVVAIKSLAGEALGASGALQAASVIEALHTGFLPGIHGLEQVEEPFLVSKLSTLPLEVSAHRALINAVGFDGQCCSLILSRDATHCGPNLVLPATIAT
jgi:3-oxoacyl-(acyl-carrier-protein) synthase